MRLLASTDFALRTLMRLAAEPERRLTTEALAREIGVPRNHLHKVVQTLAEAGLVRTVRGAGGGVSLARDPAAITLGAVVRRLERGQPLVECFRADGGACPIQPACRLAGVLAEARDAFLRRLDATRLAEFAVPVTVAPR
jgi:Rrf2 family nitric oxide-sensitive transcriptional repressor